MKQAVKHFPEDIHLMAAYARVAEEHGDWMTAADRWADFRGRFPGELAGYVSGARALSAAGLHADAKTVVSEAQRRWPIDHEVLSAAAEIAFAQRDVASAINYSEELFSHSPADPNAIFHLSRSLREAGRYTEVAALLEGAPGRFPDDDAILSIWASLANFEGDWAEAVRRWRWLQEKFPNEPKFFWQCINSLRRLGQDDKANEMLKFAYYQFPHDEVLRSMWVQSGHALLGESEAQDSDAVIQRAASFLAEGRRKAAEDCLRVAISQTPNARLLLEYAWIAHRQHEWGEAASRWEQVRAQFPQELAGYSAGVQSLRGSQSFEEAERVGTLGLQQFPNAPPLLFEIAELAARRGDWHQVVNHLQSALTVESENPDGIALLVRALRQIGKLAEAAPVIATALPKHPENRALAIENARLAEQGGDWQGAARGWQEMRHKFPDEPIGFIAGLEALNRLGDTAEWEQLLATTSARFPDLPGPAINSAWSAQRTHQWEGALARWAAIRERFGDKYVGFTAAAQVLYILGEVHEADTLLSSGKSKFPKLNLLYNDWDRLTENLRRLEQRAVTASEDRDLDSSAWDTPTKERLTTSYSEALAAFATLTARAQKMIDEPETADLQLLLRGYIDGFGSLSDATRYRFRELTNGVGQAVGALPTAGSFFEHLSLLTPDVVEIFYPRGRSLVFPARDNVALDAVEVLPTGPNEIRQEDFRDPQGAMIRKAERPPFSIYSTNDAVAYVDPFRYQLLSRDRSALWASGSPRGLSRAALPSLQEEVLDYNIVIVQDRFAYGNLCHFIFDGVTRILHYAQRFGITDHDLFVLGGIPAQYHKLLCQALVEHTGIASKNLFFPTRACVLSTSCKVFWFSDQCHLHMHPAQMAHSESIAALRALVREIPSQESSARRVYISRADADRRRVANEGDLLKALQSHGFVSVELSHLPAEEQISLFRGAEIVVAPHGQGLTHIIMSDRLRQVIELFHPDAGSDDYAIIARGMGLNYSYVTGTDLPDTPTDFRIDIDEVLASLRIGQRP